jgi:carboxylesterase type B
VFGNPYSPPNFPLHVLEAADQALHDVMAGYWTRFVATGVPGGAAGQEWRRYGEAAGHRGARRDHMIFDAVVTRGDDLREEACDFWAEFDLRSMLGAVPAGRED